MDHPTHICLDLAGVAEWKLKNLSIIESYVEFILNKLGQKLVGKPHSYQWSEGGQGITLCQILEDSALTIHTYPQEQVIYIDLFSCKTFSRLEFHRFTCDFFNSKQGYLNAVQRLTLKEAK